MTSKDTEKPAPKADDLDQASMAAIRDLLADAEPAEVPPRPSRRERKAAMVAETAAAGSLAPRAEHKVEPAPHEVEPAPEPQALRTKPAKALKGTGIVQRLKDRVTNFRPAPRMVVLALIALLVLFRPWLIVGLILLFAFMLTAVFLILGYDGFWRRVMGVARWYARRHPSRSIELHRKLDAFAMKFDAFLDRFPEGTVDGLYLPDFGDLAAADARHAEALDRRFDKLRETKA